MDAKDWYLLILGSAAGILGNAIWTLCQDQVIAWIGGHVLVRFRGAGMTGVWRSTYEYPRGPTKELWVVDHLVVIVQVGSRVYAKSLPHTDGSRVKLDLRVGQNSYLTGSWRELSPKQRVYEGAIHLYLLPTGSDARGKWLGYSQVHTIESGNWSLKRLSRTIDRGTKRKLMREVPLRYEPLCVKGDSPRQPNAE